MASKKGSSKPGVSRASSRLSESAGRFAEAGEVRCLTHPDGRTYRLEVDGCRVYESWTIASGKGHANRSTRDDAASAHAFALEKLRALEKKGYVEGESLRRTRYDRDVDVIETFHTDLDHAGKRRHDFAPRPASPHLYAHENASVAEWLITRDDRKRGVRFRAVVYESPLSDAERVAIADRVSAVLLERRAEIFADESTPLRKLALDSPIAGFTHLVVLSPEVANVSISREVNVENPILARSIYAAFPAHDCEVVGDETVAVAEARTTGRGAIPSARWDRAPHPVVDLAYPKKEGERPRFLVYDPREVEERFSHAALAKLPGPALHARNHAGEVRVYAKSAPAPSLAEVRAFFGFAR